MGYLLPKGYPNTAGGALDRSAPALWWVATDPGFCLQEGRVEYGTEGPRLSAKAGDYYMWVHTPFQTFTFTITQP
jgi:hypothetical protein